MQAHLCFNRSHIYSNIFWFLLSSYSQEQFVICKLRLPISILTFETSLEICFYLCMSFHLWHTDQNRVLIAKLTVIKLGGFCLLLGMIDLVCARDHNLLRFWSGEHIWVYVPSFHRGHKTA